MTRRTVAKDAATGEFVSGETEASSPRTTYRQKVSADAELRQALKVAYEGVVALLDQLEAGGILTADQRERWDERIADWRERGLID